MSNDSLDVKEKTLKGYEKDLADLLKDPFNALCADCGAKGPRWASYNLGVFLCIRCGGLHRRLGTHITKVKSITLDTWGPEHIKVMKEWGNVKANEFFIPNPELYTIPTESEGDMEAFLREKYEKRVFMNPLTCKSKFKVGSVTNENPTLLAKYSLELWRLKDMGYLNTEMSILALKQHAGSIVEAADWLSHQPGSKIPSDMMERRASQQQGERRASARPPSPSTQLDFFAQMGQNQQVSAPQPPSPVQQQAPQLDFFAQMSQSAPTSAPQDQAQQVDLFGAEVPAAQPVQKANAAPVELDFFGSMSAPVATQVPQKPQVQQPQKPTPAQTQKPATQLNAVNELMDVFGNGNDQPLGFSTPAQPSNLQDNKSSGLVANETDAAAKVKTNKSDILALFNQPGQNNAFGGNQQIQQPNHFQQGQGNQFQQQTQFQQQPNPFGQGQQNANPFSQQQNNAFGVASNQQQSQQGFNNSFAPRAAPMNSPFGQPQAQSPFGQQGFAPPHAAQIGQQASPFGQQQAQQFGQQAGNPFGAQGQSPFGQPQQQQAFGGQNSFF